MEGPVSMMARVEEVLPIHVGDHLLEHGSLQHLAQDGEDGHRPVVFWIKFTTFSFIQGYNFCKFPLGWKFVVLQGVVGK